MQCYQEILLSVQVFYILTVTNWVGGETNSPKMLFFKGSDKKKSQGIRTSVY